jgi:hypothetical protein
MCRYKLQPYNRSNKGGDEEKAPKVSGFFKKEYTDDNSAYGSNACPYCVGSA